MEKPGKLTLPALRAHMGDWAYYVGVMRLSDIAARVSFADEIHKSEALRQMIQRTLDESKHGPLICKYLLKDRQRLFNSLVVAVYGGAPQWHELAVRGPEKIDPELDSVDRMGVLGFLTLDGNEKLFALDGQHRVSGIKAAVKQKPALGSEEVSVIFVGHETDARGLERSRRLFTRLNRFAKPVRKEEIIALDEDDSVAIITRRFVDEDPVWKNKISLAKTKAMPVGDQRSITTIGTIYDCLDDYLGWSLPGKEWQDFKRTRPSDAELKRLMGASQQLWRVLGRGFPSFGQALKSPDTSKIMPQVRHAKGGEIIFRPVGLQVMVRTIVSLRKQGRSLAQAVKAIARVRMNLEDAPWAGLLWNTGKRRMLTTGENKKAAHLLLFWLAGGNLHKVNGASEERLRVELEGILNKPAGTLSLADVRHEALR